MLFEPAFVKVSFAFVPVCQCVDLVSFKFCHPQVSFLDRPLFTMVNSVHTLAVCNVIKPVNSPYHICKAFPAVHYTTSIPKHFSHRRHENVTSFPPPWLNLLSTPGTKSHCPFLALKINLSPIPSFQPVNTSTWNFQQVSSSTKSCSLFMTLINVMLLNQPSQYNSLNILFSLISLLKIC